MSHPRTPVLVRALAATFPVAALQLISISDEDGDGRADRSGAGAGNGWVSVWWERVPWPAPEISGGGG